MHSDISAAEEIRTLTFDDLPLAPFLKETVRLIGYTEPTPIQAEAIPLVCEGRDLIGLAQTGTGKTAAFILPILQKLSGSKEKGVKVLILAPTRELAEQINDVIKELAPRTGVKSVTIYGGVSHGRQISDLRGRPQIIVACPGRLLDHMSGRTVDLSGVETLVLDEADRMFDMGFMPDIKRIISKIPTERQTLLFSATMPPEIQELTRGIQNNPVTVRVKIEAANASVAHSMYQVQQKSKPEMLHYWLKENKEALVVVFTKMKHTAKRLAEQLARKGQHVTSMHGNLSQAKRQHSLNGFKDGRYRILIATDIAARGIDVKGITHVVNYDMPENLDAYIHRTGRAGRASATGEAVSFVTRADGALLRTIERWLKKPVTKLETPELEGIVSEELSLGAPEGRERRSAGPRGGRGARSSRGERAPRREQTGRRDRSPRDQQPSDEQREPALAVVSREEGGESAPRRSTRPSARGERSDRGSRGPRAPRRDGERSEQRSFNSDRAPRGRSGDRFERGGERGNYRGSRPAGRGRDFNREGAGERSERQPHYAFGPEGERRSSRPRSEQGSQGRSYRPRGGADRGGSPQWRGPRSEGRSDRGQPRDRFQALEGPDLTQGEALKVLDRRERQPRSNGGGRRPGARGPSARGADRGGRSYGRSSGGPRQNRER